MRYNYGIFGQEWDLYKHAFSELMEMENVMYIANPTKKGAIYNFFYRVHHSNKANRWFELPLKNLWNYTYFHNCFKNEKPIVFVFLRTWLYLEEYGFMSWLKKKYKNSFLVLYMTDLVSTTDNEYSKQVAQRDSLFDLKLSFDHGDCERYGFSYYPQVFSEYKNDQKNDMLMSDIYFCGLPKNRWNDIVSVFERCWDLGLDTDFTMVWVKLKDRVYENRVRYLNKLIPYEENLQRTIHSRSVLEVMQSGG